MISNDDKGRVCKSNFLSCPKESSPSLGVMVPKKHKSHPFMVTEQKPPSTLSGLPPENPWRPRDACSPP